MADNTYILKLVVDPSNLFGGALPGRIGSNGTSGGSGDKALPKPSLFDGIFGKLKKPLQGLGKIGIISLAVTGIFAMFKQMFGMFVNASPMLQVMMKLLNTAVTFILRPIGDFIGFFLRPILIYMLRYIALPFYRHFMPIGRQLGALLGQPIADILKNLSGAFSGAKGIGNSVVAGATSGSKLGESFGPIGSFLGTLLGGVGALLASSFASIFPGGTEAVTNWFTGLSNDISPNLNVFGETVNTTKDGVINLGSTVDAYNLVAQDGITGMNNLITWSTDVSQIPLGDELEAEIEKMKNKNGEYIDAMGNIITRAQAMAIVLVEANNKITSVDPLGNFKTIVSDFNKEIVNMTEVMKDATTPGGRTPGGSRDNPSTGRPPRGQNSLPALTTIDHVLNLKFNDGPGFRIPLEDDETIEQEMEVNLQG